MNETPRGTENGKPTIPTSLREKYDRAPGDEVRWADTEDGTVVGYASRECGRARLVPENAAAEAREAIAGAFEPRVRDHRQEIDARLRDGRPGTSKR